MRKRVRVLCDSPQGLIDCVLELPQAATIAEALAAAHALLGRVELAAPDTATGIFGRLQPRTYVPADGDRIELYRPLAADPRSRRRERASTAAARARRER